MTAIMPTMKTKLEELAAKWRGEAGDIQELFAACMRECAAELEAALADQWQPIETAPKDAEKILLFGDCLNSGEPTIEAGWLDQEGKVEWPIETISATHWMPLPACPSTSPNPEKP